MTEPVARVIVAAVQRRTEELVAALRARSDHELALASNLPEWSRLTILCHLRYGATMTAHMTRATLDGQPTTFYPEGRATQRPPTLLPAPGESTRRVIESLAEQSAALADLWAGVSGDQWEHPVVDSGDVGQSRMSLTIGDLASLRLTEVEVHGTDLGIGLREWSAEFVHVTLPRRITWLGRRTPPKLDPSTELPMTWLLAATDGPSYTVRIDREGQTTAEVAAAESIASEATSQNRIEGSSRELLAMILGRGAHDDDAPASATALFRQTFPGP